MTGLIKCVMSASAPELPAVRTITSAKNQYVQHCVKLRTQKRYREQCRRLLLVGKDLIEEVLGRIQNIDSLN